MLDRRPLEQKVKVACHVLDQPNERRLGYLSHNVDVDAKADDELTPARKRNPAESVIAVPHPDLGTFGSLNFCRIR